MSTEQDYSIEQWAEATAAVVGTLVTAVFRIVYALFFGIVRGLCLLPILSGLRKAIKAELANKE